MEETTKSHKWDFLNPKIGPDSKFIVGANWGDIQEEFTGHKDVFAYSSPVFEAMFFGGIPEEGDIEIPDVHPDAFRTMVDFFYTGKISVTSEDNAVNVWYVADKYNIAELIKYITTYFVQNITTQNVFYILNLSNLYSNEIVMNKCRKIILTEILTVLNASSFLNVDLSTLNFILNQEELNVSEVALFKALERYDNARKNNSDDAVSLDPTSTSPGKSRLGYSNPESTEVKEDGSNPVKELVKKIRFLTMTPKEFIECVEMSPLLSTSEALNILGNITDPTVCPMPEGYCTSKRKRQPGKIYCLHAHRCYIEGLSAKLKEPFEFSVTIRTKTNIKLTGVEIYLPKVRQFGYDIEIGKYNLTIEIKEHFIFDFHMFYQNVIFFQCLFDVEEIEFHKPVYISSGTLFTISFVLKPLEFGLLHTYFQFATLYCYCDHLEDNYELKFNRDCNCKDFIKSIIFTTA